MSDNHSRLPQALADMFANLSSSWCIDDAGAARYRREQEQFERAERMAQRRERILREHIPLTRDVRAALIAGEPLARDTVALTATKTWLGSETAAPTLVLVGGTGTGKSVAAAYACVNAPLSWNFKWRPASTIVRAFAQLFGDGPAQQQQCFDCDLLVIEDLGAESERERMGTALVELLEGRGKDPNRRTLITTNLTQRSLFETYPDKRLHSRMGPRLVAWVYCPGSDMREGA